MFCPDFCSDFARIFTKNIPDAELGTLLLVVKIYAVISCSEFSLHFASIYKFLNLHQMPRKLSLRTQWCQPTFDDVLLAAIVELPGVGNCESG